MDNELEGILLFLANQPSNNFLFPIEEIASNKTESLRGVAMWDDFINYHSRDSTIRIFIFSKSLVDKKGWDYVIKHKKYLKKYELIEADLNERNWTIVYERN